MLKITRHHAFHLPSAHHRAQRRVALGHLPADDDELLQAIQREQDESMITLDNTPDVRALDDFWAGVQEDLKKDPEWFNFAED